MTSRQSVTLFIVAWAAFMTIVAASNATELLHAFGVWSPTFRSGNLGFIATATSIYGASNGVNIFLLAGAMAWEAMSAGLLWRAARRLGSGAADALSATRTALVVLGLLWFQFAIATELLIAYDRGVNESMYWILAIAVLATLTVAELTLKEEGPAR